VKCFGNAAAARKVVFDALDAGDRLDVPPRGITRTSHARRRSSAVQETRRRRPGLPAGHPPPPRPAGEHARSRRLDDRREPRARLPFPPLRAAPAGPDPRAARAGVAVARHAAGPPPAALGDPPHRGSAGQPVRDVHQGPSLPYGRRLGAATAAGHAQRRPGRHGLSPALGIPRRGGLQASGTGVRFPVPERATHAQPGRRARARRGQGGQRSLPRAHTDAADAGSEDHVQRADRRCPAVRRAVLVARPRPQDRRERRDVPQRRRARDVRGRPAIPARPPATTSARCCAISPPTRPTPPNA